MKTLRIVLGTILAIVSLNALGGGYYGMSGAKNIPLAWLEGSPFHSYFFPSLFLFIMIGGTCLIATIAIFRNARNARPFAFYAAILMISWIIVQVSVIGYVSWMQPAIFSAGLLVFVLTYFLPKMRTVEQSHPLR